MLLNLEKKFNEKDVTTANINGSHVARFIQWRCVILGRGKQIKRNSLRTNFDKLVNACYSLDRKKVA